MKQYRNLLSLIVGGATCAVANAGTPFTIQPLVLEGDNVPGVGAVTSIDNLAINNAGTWLVEADTNNSDTNADGVMLRDGALYLREGQALAAPAGASIGSFDAVNLNNLGNSGWNLFLDGTSGGSDDSGIYFNTDLVLQEGTASASPSFSPGTNYIGFFESYINDGNSVLAISSLDDPAIPSGVDRALVVFSPLGGGLWSENVIAKETDPAPGTAETFTDFGTGPHETAFNNGGHILFAADLTGDSAMNAAIYLDDTLIAREGSASPIGGRDWLALTDPEQDLNNNGDFVFSGRLTGDTATDTLIVKNGQKFMQEGDVVPDLGQFLIESFGTGPIKIDDAGNVLWYAEWSDPDTDKDTGLFLNGTLLVQEGVSSVNGVIIDTLRGIQDGYTLSDDGKWVLFEAILVDGTEGAFLISVPEPASIVALLAGALVAGRRRRFVP